MQNDRQHFCIPSIKAALAAGASFSGERLGLPDAEVDAYIEDVRQHRYRHEEAVQGIRISGVKARG